VDKGRKCTEEEEVGGTFFFIARWFMKLMTESPGLKQSYSFMFPKLFLRVNSDDFQVKTRALSMIFFTPPFTIFSKTVFSPLVWKNTSPGGSPKPVAFPEIRCEIFKLPFLYGHLLKRNLYHDSRDS